MSRASPRKPHLIQTPSETVKRYVTTETHIVGLASLEYETAPGFVIARSEEKCKKLFDDVHRNVQEQEKLMADLKYHQRHFQNEQRLARMARRQHLIEQDKELTMAGKREEYEAVKRKEGTQERVEKTFNDTMAKCTEKRVQGAFKNQTGLDELHNRTLDISEDYNCKVKNWDRSTPRAIRCPRFVDPPLAITGPHTPDLPVLKQQPKKPAAGQLEKPEEIMTLAGLGSFADGPPPVRARTPRTTQYVVSEKSLKKWLHTEDPAREEPAPRPPGARMDHQPRVIIRSCFPEDYVQGHFRL